MYASAVLEVSLGQPFDGPVMTRSQLEPYPVLDVFTRLTEYAVVEQFKQFFLEIVGSFLSLVIIKLYVW